MDRNHPARYAFAIVLGLSVHGPNLLAQSQPPDDPFASARFRFRGVALSPRVAITNVGIDNNVFNEIDHPRSDLTATVAPELRIWVRTGAGQLMMAGRADLVYFQKFRTERAVNGSGEARYEYRFNRLQPFVHFQGIDARERPGYEIDLRARRFETITRLGVRARIASKSALEFAGHRQDTRYAGDAIFEGRALNEALNRVAESLDITWRHRLTALTTFVFGAAAERERFEFSATRNSESTRTYAGFELGRFALIRGNATVGFRRLVGVDGGTLPKFAGVTADTNVAYTAPTQTRIGLSATRDVYYSHQPTTPYYVQTGWSVTLTQRVFGPWDIQLLGGQDRLGYRAITGANESRTDVIHHVGGGIGYQLGDNVRLGFDVRSHQRESVMSARDYKGLRAGLSVTYGY